jgi:hypothetical protein
MAELACFTLFDRVPFEPRAVGQRPRAPDCCEHSQRSGRQSRVSTGSQQVAFFFCSTHLWSAFRHSCDCKTFENIFDVSALSRFYHGERLNVHRGAKRPLKMGDAFFSTSKLPTAKKWKLFLSFFTFCWAKLNHRTLLSTLPPKFGNDCDSEMII